jgi:prepilin-type N-terminal cleavage/methylation domain-containing protein
MRLIKSKARGFSLVELLIVSAIMSIIILSVLALYSSGQRYFITESARADMLRSGKEVLNWISRDIKEGIELLPSWASYTTSNNCLVLKIPSVDANGIITDIESDFDYIIYRLSPSNPRRLERIVDAKDGVSSRADSRRVIAEKVDSFVMRSEGVELSSVTDLSQVSIVDVTMLTQQTIFGKTQQEILRTEVKLRNKQD